MEDNSLWKEVVAAKYGKLSHPLIKQNSIWSGVMETLKYDIEGTS